MVVDQNKYLKILELELEHLVNDISSVIQYEKELHDNRTHTNFVYLENLVVLKDEIMGINGILGEITNFKVGPNENIEEKLLEKIEAFVKSRGYPTAVLHLIENKMRKIEEIKGIC
ncbi:hypothetical protein EW093_14155 [Thiospirochaeta perfilievii]|uniref:Uncharacterized protein n=1 Tax=Thiospirochaeta perfilievii TaxID=252967 RepID=A0A5C1QCF8_9SPIO|nr:hypothetical protein [Thiospirochaeta perfilievii]QEN05795.1 hypothetical protein EW093_14155 [Thiospirochaeta perfilievii]